MICDDLRWLSGDLGGTSGLVLIEFPGDLECPTDDLEWSIDRLFASVELGFRWVTSASCCCGSVTLVWCGSVVLVGLESEALGGDVPGIGDIDLR